MKLLLINEFDGEVTGYVDLARGELRGRGPFWSIDAGPKPMRNITLLEYIGIPEFHMEQPEEDQSD